MTLQADASCVVRTREAVNFGERADHLPIDILLLHYTGMETGQAAEDWLCAEQSGVSCHYLVHEDGEIVQMVAESSRAWHAGKSKWAGEADTNSRSIGIEIVNPGHSLDYPDFPEVQINAVIELSKNILSRHPIPARNVLAHSDVAPGRKQDPGEKFPWQKLFEAGVGHWVPPSTRVGEGFIPGQNAEEVAAFKAHLIAYGYGLELTGNYDEPTKNCVKAFQQHFRQSNVDGIADISTVETLEALIAALNS